MTFVIGMIIVMGCLFGGFAAMGGHIGVLWQPFEYIIILGTAIGTFFVANPMKVVKDSMKGIIEAIKESTPKPRDYLDTLAILYALMRELRTKTRTEMEVHVDNPAESDIFKAFPKILADKDMTNFICDYCRLIIIGNARTHEIEAPLEPPEPTQPAHPASTQAPPATNSSSSSAPGHSLPDPASGSPTTASQTCSTRGHATSHSTL